MLSDDEITRIIDIFNAGKAEEDFCVAVSYADIEAKKLSFSAGQYFDIKIDYVDISAEEFENRMENYKADLKAKFEESHKIEKEIMKQLESLFWEKGYRNHTAKVTKKSHLHKHF